nr:glycosyltransferase [Argonema antarcticum]
MPLGVNQPVYWPQAKQKLREIYGIAVEKPVVLFLSRLHYKKRPDLLVQALGKLAAKQSKFHLVLAGSGETDYLNYLKSLVLSLGLTAETTFPGFVEGQDKDLLLQGADIFVLPSFSENFGIAVAEALAHGLPVIITPDIQIAPEIAAAKAGLVVEGEVEPLANAIAQLLTSPQQRQDLGENGKDLVQRRYSWSAIASHLTGVYRSIIERERLPDRITFP